MAAFAKRDGNHQQERITRQHQWQVVAGEHAGAKAEHRQLPRDPANAAPWPWRKSKNESKRGGKNDAQHDVVDVDDPDRPSRRQGRDGCDDYHCCKGR